MRFLFAPVTLGAITWLARNCTQVPKIAGGFTLVCLGDEHPLTYKRTVQGDAGIDRAAARALAAAVIHLAAISNDPPGNRNPQCTYDNNSHGFGVAREGGPRGLRRALRLLVVVQRVRSRQPGGLAGREGALQPGSPYAESKVLVERDLPALATDDFSPTYMRNATVYGVSRRLHGEPSVGLGFLHRPCVAQESRNTLASAHPRRGRLRSTQKGACDR